MTTDKAALQICGLSPVRTRASLDKIHGPEVEIFRALGSLVHRFFPLLPEGRDAATFLKINCCLNELDLHIFALVLINIGQHNERIK